MSKISKIKLGLKLMPFVVFYHPISCVSRRNLSSSSLRQICVFPLNHSTISTQFDFFYVHCKPICPDEDVFLKLLRKLYIHFIQLHTSNNIYNSRNYFPSNFCSQLFFCSFCSSSRSLLFSSSCSLSLCCNSSDRLFSCS